MRTVTLLHDARVFDRTPGSRQLRHTEFFLTKGTAVTIGEPETLLYDHRDQEAVPFSDVNDVRHYLILRELRMLEQIEGGGASPP